MELQYFCLHCFWRKYNHKLVWIYLKGLEKYARRKWRLYLGKKHPLYQWSFVFLFLFIYFFFWVGDVKHVCTYFSKHTYFTKCKSHRSTGGILITKAINGNLKLFRTTFQLKFLLYRNQSNAKVDLVIPYKFILKVFFKETYVFWPIFQV